MEAWKVLLIIYFLGVGIFSMYLLSVVIFEKIKRKKERSQKKHDKN